MKWKSYLRGAGLGLILAALITATGSKASMSDEEIIARAKALGMVDGNTYLVSEKMPQTQPQETVSEEETPGEEILQEIASEEASPDETVAEEIIPEETVSEETEPEEKAPEEVAPEENVPDETTSEETTSEEMVSEETDSIAHQGDMVEFRVQSGDSSLSVSKRLAGEGLVGDAEAFDRFLCQNGYDKKIRVGNYQIERDSSDEQIANIITGKK